MGRNPTGEFALAKVSQKQRYSVVIESQEHLTAVYAYNVFRVLHAVARHSLGALELFQFVCQIWMGIVYQGGLYLIRKSG